MIFVEFFHIIVYDNICLTMPSFIEVPAPSQVTGRSYLYDVYDICRVFGFICVNSIFHLHVWNTYVGIQ